MTKTITTGSLTTTYMVIHHNHFSAIVMVTQNGRNLKNEFGGYPTRNVGKKTYIENLFKKI